MSQSRCSVLNLLLLSLFTIDIVRADLFNECDVTYNIGNGSSYLQSPNFPNSYEPGTSCRYKFIAPLDHEIVLSCTIYLDRNTNTSQCSTEFFYVAIDGDTKLRNSEQFCGYGSFNRTSLFNYIVVAFESGGSWGNFECELFVQPQACDCGWSVNSKIVNGEEASMNAYPSIAALNDTSNNQVPFCGCTIITHRFLTTAAHCTVLQPDPTYLVALVGQHDLDVPNRYSAQYAIEQIFQHPNYTSTSNGIENDISILFTIEDIVWSRGVGPACLFSEDYKNDFAYSDVDLVGWGTTSFGGSTSKKLQKVTLMVQTNSVCQTEYQGIATINADQMCTYDSFGKSQDSCQFDSGGPNYLQLSRQFIIGVVSFGKGCGIGNSPGYPMGVNTRLTSFSKWIYQTIGYTSCPVAMQ